MTNALKVPSLHEQLSKIKSKICSLLLSRMQCLLCLSRCQCSLALKSYMKSDYLPIGCWSHKWDLTTFLLAVEVSKWTAAEAWAAWKLGDMTSCRVDHRSDFRLIKQPFWNSPIVRNLRKNCTFNLIQFKHISWLWPILPDQNTMRLQKYYEEFKGKLWWHVL